MGTTTETRISSTQAKDAIYKAHSINSSASEIDDISGTVLSGDIFAIVNTEDRILISSESVPTFTITDTLIVKEITREIEKLNINTIAQGRVGSGSPDIVVNGNGLTHPKMIYIKDGWNGYRYWLAATPYFGVIGTNSEYENPHVFASNDLITWTEPSGGKIDTCDEGSTNYLSDTHLMIGNDSFLYCFYRNNTDTSRKYYYKKTSDGINWGDRETIFDTDLISNVSKGNLALSPVIINDNGIHIFDAMRSSDNLIIAPSNSCSSTFILHRYANNINDLINIQKVNTYQVCRYDNRLWGTKDPWHIDVVKVGKFYIQLINTGVINGNDGDGLYLAYSIDGFNYKVLCEYEYYGISFFYRSSLTLIRETETDIELKMIIAKKNGELSSVKIVLGV